MTVADPSRSVLLVVDFQSRLMPAIADGEQAVANAKRLLGAAKLLDVPVIYTEQNPRGLGATVPDIAPEPPAKVVSKMTFDAWRAPDLQGAAPPSAEFVVTGCEAHVCVLQTVLGLREAGRAVKVVRDAIGSRRPESKEAALARMERHGAEIVTTEMVAFEWLGSAEHPRFREVMTLIK